MDRLSFDEGKPWYFDPDLDVPKSIPAGKLDFVSVALHEMCHVLGFGTADAFKSLAGTGAFDGTKARSRRGRKGDSTDERPDALREHGPRNG